MTARTITVRLTAAQYGAIIHGLDSASLELQDEADLHNPGAASRLTANANATTAIVRAWQAAGRPSRGRRP